MDASATAADSPPSATPAPAAAEKDLLPFFVLHKASSTNPDAKSVGTVKTRRRIDLSPSKPKIAKRSEAESTEEHDEQFYSRFRSKAFETVWSKIESTSKDVLRDMNTGVFNEIYDWIQESFGSIRLSMKPGSLEVIRSFPVVTDATSKQLFTALVLTKSMEIVDDLLTFEELGLHLKSRGCHVANLSSSDFLAKNGVGGCLKSLLRQLLMTMPDVADLSALASWYGENGKYNIPVVVIVDDTERCCGSVLSNLILMLSEWAIKIPVILIMGVATTLDAPRKILSTNALQHLCPRRFTLGSPAERMDAVVKAVLVKQCSGFIVSHKVGLFMRNYFVCQDGTLTSFIRALKVACLQHFSTEPLSFLLEQFCQEGNIQVLSSENPALLTEETMKHAFDLPSFKRNKLPQDTGEILVHGLSELRRLQSLWGIVLLCLYEAGKYDKIQLLDLFCEALDPEAYRLRTSNLSIKKDGVTSPTRVINQQYNGLTRGSFFSQVLRKLRDLSPAQISVLLKKWENLTADASEIHDKVKELQSSFKFVDATSQRQEFPRSPRKNTSRSQSKLDKDLRAMTEKVAALTECMLRDYMQPIESIPFHEIVCFKNVDELQSALLGDPRRRIQVDLLEFHKVLRCTCCNRRGTTLLPSMHDTSIMYTLAQEHGDLINLHDWYQSFKTIFLSISSKDKQKAKRSPLPKKRKDIGELEVLSSEALIQARFCRAVTELQITGLIRMPTKRRPDFVQRVAFGF